MNGRSVLMILLSIAAGSLLICAGMIFVGFRYLAKFRPTLPTIPPALVTAGVTEGTDFLDKRLAFSDAGIGSVTDLLRQPAADVELGIAGTGGAVLVDAAGSVKSRVTFASTPRDVRFVDVDGDGDGNWEYLNRGGAGWGDASLMDQTGRTLWTHGGLPGVNGMVAGDLDRDGTLDFVVGMNGGGGVKRLDTTGNVLWTQSDGNVWHVEIVDGDGTPEIVHSNAGGQLTLRNQYGKIIRQTRPSAYLSNFSLCNWPDEKGAAHLIASRDNKIQSRWHPSESRITPRPPSVGCRNCEACTFVKQV